MKVTPWPVQPSILLPKKSPMINNEMQIKGLINNNNNYQLSFSFSVLQHGHCDEMPGGPSYATGLSLLPADVSVQGAGRWSGLQLFQGLSLRPPVRIRLEERWVLASWTVNWVCIFHKTLSSSRHFFLPAMLLALCNGMERNGGGLTTLLDPN